MKISTQNNFVHAGSELVPVGGDQVHPAALAVQDHCVHTHASLGLQLGQNILYVCLIILFFIFNFTIIIST